MHEVSVIRAGVRIPAFSPAGIRVIEKEEDSDKRIYDGERTALIFVKVTPEVAATCVARNRRRC